MYPRYTQHRSTHRRRVARRTIALVALPLALAAYPAAAAPTSAPSPVPSISAPVRTAVPPSYPVTAACRQKLAATSGIQKKEIIERCLALATKPAPVAVPIAGQPTFTG